MTTEKISCPYSVELVGVRFPCQLDFGHWGKCLHDLVCNDTTLTWFPSQEEKSAVMAKILHEAKGSRSPEEK